MLVLDTNIVLDLFVYEDPATLALREQLAQPATRWLATAAMREELARVLGYPQIVKRLTARALPAEAVLALFDQRVEIVPAAPKAPYTCKDADDQRFIDLAVAAPGGAGEQGCRGAVHGQTAGQAGRGGEAGLGAGLSR